jgi:uncharacterized membrane protein YgaE (UPF0421/DUF939 family)
MMGSRGDTTDREAAVTDRIDTLAAVINLLATPRDALDELSHAVATLREEQSKIEAEMATAAVNHEERLAAMTAAQEAQRAVAEQELIERHRTRGEDLDRRDREMTDREAACLARETDAAKSVEAARVAFENKLKALRHLVDA